MQYQYVNSAFVSLNMRRVLQHRDGAPASTRI